MKRLAFGMVVSALAFAAFANTNSPYVGQEPRQIKALSEQEVEDYLNGEGLGYAKAAELNHYPGPRHVLDLAKELMLTNEQTTRTQEIFNGMRARAIPLGKQLVEKERELDREFAARSIREDSLNALLSDIGVLEAKIRYVHLSAHLEQKELLTKHQIQVYDQLRGYGNPQGARHNHSR
jgi:Spy/CpxP family protein refolding chaperone